MKINLISTVIMLMILITLVSVKVSAGFALGFPYEIKGNPGETHREIVSLQNRIEPVSDITIEIVVVSGGEYLSFPEGKIIEIAANDTKNIPMDVVIPQNAKSGRSLDASLLFKQVAGSSQSQGTVGVSLTISKEFKIKVEGEETNNKAIIVSSILAVLVVILIIILIRTLMHRKN
ncbi:MAG: hypothetical protein ACP5NS_03795 [Candidatus Pacearchaeota archaeon]